MPQKTAIVNESGYPPMPERRIMALLLSQAIPAMNREEAVLETVMYGSKTASPAPRSG